MKAERKRKRGDERPTARPSRPGNGTSICQTEGEAMGVAVSISNAPVRPTEQTPKPGEYAHWIVALVEPQREKRVRDWLWEQSGIPSYLPVERVTVVRCGRKVEVENLMARGYLFVPAAFKDYAQLMRGDRTGVRGTMRASGDDPDRGILVVVPDAALNPIRQIEANLNDPKWLAGKPRKYRAGQAVKLMDGAWRGLFATVEALRDGGRLVVDIGGVLGHVCLEEDRVIPA